MLASLSMREILVVRHGQASARARDYDVLSPLGARQSRRLGEHLAAGSLRFDAVFSGPRRRQLDTARHLVAAARAAGAALPDAVELPSLDEIPLGHILALWLPGVVAGDAVARAIAEQRWEHPESEIRRVLASAMLAWAAGEVASPSLPSFADFVARIDAALAHIAGHGAATLLVTSAGPVATALHLGGHAAARTPAEVMRTAMSVPNASVTRLLHDGARLRVEEAHDVVHLAPDERSLM
jgi:broad specificity phosphatase PhoE